MRFYRGQYGERNTLETKLTSLTFTKDVDLARTYALFPNLKGDTVHTSRIFTVDAEVQRWDMAFSSPGDAYMDLHVVRALLCDDAVVQAAFVAQTEHIWTTNSWVETEHPPVTWEELMADDTLQDAVCFCIWRMLDVPAVIERLRDAGYSIAVYLACGEVEYRIFNTKIIKHCTSEVINELCSD